jgi:hypothetical protein
MGIAPGVELSGRGAHADGRSFGEVNYIVKIESETKAGDHIIDRIVPLGAESRF